MVARDHRIRAAGMAALAVIFVLTLNGVAAARPGAAFSLSATIPNVGDPVTFVASSSNGTEDQGDGAGAGAGAASYAWDFGDGTSGSGATTVHRYGSGGDKTVTLTVTAADGGTVSRTQTVHINVPPTAAIVIPPPAGQSRFTPLAGQPFALSAQGSSDPDGSIDSYAWDTGDGTFGAPGPSKELPVSFPAGGTRTARVRVTDNGGATTIAQVTFRVNTPPIAGFSLAPAAPAPNALVTFTSTSTDADNDLTALNWDLNGDGKFDDGAGATTKAVYMAAGDYAVGLQATDSAGATSTAFRTVSVQGPALPKAATDPAGGPVVLIPSPGAAPVKAPAAGASPSSRSGGRLRAVPGARVRIAGSVVGSRTRITQLVVLGPPGAIVSARCRGGGCPRRPVSGRIASNGRLRLRRLERPLRAGARIVVSVAKQGYATKQVVLTLRSGKAPARTQACVFPDQKKPGPCA